MGRKKNYCVLGYAYRLGKGFDGILIFHHSSLFGHFGFSALTLQSARAEDRPFLGVSGSVASSVAFYSSFLEERWREGIYFEVFMTFIFPRLVR